MGRSGLRLDEATAAWHYEEGGNNPRTRVSPPTARPPAPPPILVSGFREQAVRTFSLSSAIHDYDSEVSAGPGLPARRCSARTWPSVLLRGGGCWGKVRRPAWAPAYISSQLCSKGGQPLSVCLAEAVGRRGTLYFGLQKVSVERARAFSLCQAGGGESQAGNQRARREDETSFSVN